MNANRTRDIDFWRGAVLIAWSITSPATRSSISRLGTSGRATLRSIRGERRLIFANVIGGGATCSLHRVRKAGQGGRTVRRL